LLHCMNAVRALRRMNWVKVFVLHYILQLVAACIFWANNTVYR